MQVKELVYIILDELKILSDDATFTEDHVIFLLKNYRKFLIKKEKDKEKASAESTSDLEEQQQICLDLEEVDTCCGEPCAEGEYLRTKQKLPKILEGTTPRIHPMNYYDNIRICFVSRDRMKYVGTNKYLQNIIYVSLGPDHHLYMTSNNPQFTNLEKIRMTAIFEDFDKALDYQCDDAGNSRVCDPLDAEFPISGHLVPPLIELIVKELSGAIYKPKDTMNNAADDLSDLAAFIRRNSKSALQKQIEG